MPPELVDFTRTMSFRLSQVGARLAERFAELLRPTGLSPRTFAVLSAVRREGPRTQQQLADMLGMHRNNMAELAEQMGSDGLIRREPHPTDRRALQVTLTDEGRRRLDAAAGIAVQIDSEASVLLSPAEVDRLSAALDRMCETLDLRPGVHPHLGPYAAPRRRGDKTYP